jgi:hypothetical protein
MRSGWQQVQHDILAEHPARAWHANVLQHCQDEG